MKKCVFYSILFLFVFSTNDIYSQKQPKYFIKVTFEKGPLKGTHIFTPEKGNYLSQINLEFFKGVSKLNASKLTSERGFQIHYITRSFIGEAKKGEQQAKKYTSGCGSFNFIDIKNNQSYKRIDGDFTGCTNTNITKVGTWRKTVYKSKRDVSGSFSDILTMKVRMDDGTEKTIESKVTVEFTARESRRK